jgi:hypothetical protein
MSPSGLDLITQEYQRALQQPKQEKNRILVSLMNQLEKKHDTFIINPTEDESNREAVQLYKKISNARDF